jgi:uncharacterized protein YggU (UPF0235/DUF167 family)
VSPAEHSGFPVRVTPRARTDEIVGVRDGVLVLRVAAPPADDRANAAVQSLIARRLGVRASRVVLVRGERSREKVVRVEGLAADAALRALTG